MNVFVLGSKPLINLNLKCLEIAATSLMMARNFSESLEEIDALNKEIRQVNELIDHSNEILKNID
jgi:hypothetical protein